MTREGREGGGGDGLADARCSFSCYTSVSQSDPPGSHGRRTAAPAHQRPRADAEERGGTSRYSPKRGRRSPLSTTGTRGTDSHPLRIANCRWCPIVPPSPAEAHHGATAGLPHHQGMQRSGLLQQFEALVCVLFSTETRDWQRSFTSSARARNCTRGPLCSFLPRTTSSPQRSGTAC